MTQTTSEAGSRIDQPATDITSGAIAADIVSPGSDTSGADTARAVTVPGSYSLALFTGVVMAVVLGIVLQTTSLFPGGQIGDDQTQNDPLSVTRISANETSANATSANETSGAGDNAPDSARHQGNQIQQLLESTLYRIQPASSEHRLSTASSGATHAASNPEQQLFTLFENDSVRILPGINQTDDQAPAWQWQLRLQAYGRADNINAVPQSARQEAKGNKLYYHREAITEWYINRASGVEQGFTVHQAPRGNDDTIVIEMAVTGGLTPRMNSNSISFVDAASRSRLDYSKLLAWDANGHMLPSRMQVSGNTIRLLVQAEGAEYPLTIDPLVTNPEVSIGGQQPRSEYANSVSDAGDINGDGYADIVIGASKFDIDNGGSTIVSAGKIYIYYGTETGIDEASPQEIEGDQANALLGFSVSGAGDINGDGFSDVIASAQDYHTGGGATADAGRIYVYFGGINGLDTLSPIVIDGDQGAGRVGTSVSGAGDVNGDGYDDVIIGARAYDTVVGVNSGKAEVYLGGSTGLDVMNPIVINGSQAFSEFGISVSDAGDVNDDGFDDIIVGANKFNTAAGNNAGAAFVFLGSVSGPDPMSPIQIDGDQAEAQFGISVAGAGDTDGDGHADIIIGATLYDGLDAMAMTLVDSGAAFIYRGDGTGIDLLSEIRLDGSQDLLDPNPANVPEFGASVSAADINGDGYSDVSIGSNNYHSKDDSGNDLRTGGVFTYFGSASGIDPQSRYTIDGPQFGSQHGVTLSSAGDINNDGYEDLFIGASGYDDQVNGNPLLNAGIAYIHLGGASGVSSQTISVEGDQANRRYGIKIADAGDINADGFGDIIVGTRNYGGNGAAFVYYGSMTGIDTLSPEQINGTQGSSRFGEAVAGAGDVNGDGYDDVIIGAPQYNTGAGNNAGAFYIYLAKNDGSGLDLVSPPISVEGTQALARFGFHVDSAGDVNGDGRDDVVVTSVDYDVTSPAFINNAGAFHVYLGTPTGIDTGSPIFVEGDQAAPLFGWAATTAGDVDGDGYDEVIVSAINYNSVDSDGIQIVNAGAVFMYHGTSTGLNTTPVRFDSGQSNTSFGRSISNAGDVNADGYSDIIIGSSHHDTLDEQGEILFNAGALFLGLGSASGVDPASLVRIDGDQDQDSPLDSGQLGSYVSLAGDVNGDGYDDVIAGASKYDVLDDDGNELVDAGQVYIYLGNSTGLDTASPVIIKGDQAGGELGTAVSNAGDVDADGLADVIMAAPRYDTTGPLSDAGMLYIGSNATLRHPRPRQVDGAEADIAEGGLSQDLLRVRYTAMPHPSNGYSKAKLEVEACPQFVAFGDPACDVDITANWTDLADTGTEIALDSTVHDGLKHWRARLHYTTDRIDLPGISGPAGPLYSPWRANNDDALAPDINIQFAAGNLAPTITGVPDSEAMPGVQYVFSPLGDDLNTGTVLTYNILNAPSWASFDTVTGMLYGTPADTDYGDYPGIEITADDGALSDTLGPFSITVIDDRPPVINSEIDQQGTIFLTCFDAGASGCSGTIFYTDDGTPPSGTSMVYDPITGISGVDPADIRVYVEDTSTTQPSVNSTIQLAQFVTLDALFVSGDIGDLADVSGTYDESLFTVTDIEVSISGSGVNLNNQPASFTGGTWDYSIPNGLSFINEERYDVVVKATDANGNTSSVSRSYTHYAGGQVTTTLSLTLLKTSIQVDGDVDMQATLKRADQPDFDFSGRGYELELWVELPDTTTQLVATQEVTGTSFITFDDIGSAGSGITFSAPGEYRFWVEFEGNLILAASDTSANRQSLLVGTSAGYAVVIQGKLSNNEGLASHNKTTKRIYNTLRTRGFADEDILYYGYFNDAFVDGIPDKTTIGADIAALATKINAQPADLYVFMVDHGGFNADPADTAFYIDNEVITPTDLDIWLDALETGLVDDTITNRIAIVGSCYSGGFIPVADGEANRAVISSATADEQSFKGPEEADGVRTGELFIEYLLDELVDGATLGNAFKAATLATEEYTRDGDPNAVLNDFLDTSLQHPLVNDNADAIGTNAIFDNDENVATPDGALIAGLKLGFDRETDKNDSDLVARILGVPGPIYLDDSTAVADLTMIVNDDSLVSAAYAEIRPPLQTLEAAPLGTSEQIESDYDKQGFSQTGNPEEFGQTYSDFTDSGIYEVFYYVNDLDGTLVEPRRSLVYRDDAGNAAAPTQPVLQAPVDAAANLNGQATIFDWTDSTDADGDDVSYTFYIADDNTFSSFKQANKDPSVGGCSNTAMPYIQYGLSSSSTFVDASSRLCEGSAYVWKVEAVDAFGKNTSSPVFSFTTSAFNNSVGVVVAMVKSSQTNARLSGMNLLASGTGGQTAAPGEETSSVNYNGNYVMFVLDADGSSFALAASDPGGDYQQRQVSAAVRGGQTREYVFSLTSATVDSDGDGVFDDVDNCPQIANAGQANNDGDSKGDACDPDDDNDGMSDDYENTWGLNPLSAADRDLDSDGDTFSNYIESLNNTDPTTFTAPEIDTDGDGVFDANDNCPQVANTNQANNDNDGRGDVCDPDDDNDGMTDSFEDLYGLNPFDARDADEDADGDGITNLEEFNAGSSPSSAEAAVNNAAAGDGGGGGGSLNLWALLVTFLLLLAYRRRHMLARRAH